MTSHDMATVRERIKSEFETANRLLDESMAEAIDQLGLE